MLCHALSRDRRVCVQDGLGYPTLPYLPQLGPHRQIVHPVQAQRADDYCAVRPGSLSVPRRKSRKASPSVSILQHIHPGTCARHHTAHRSIHTRQTPSSPVSTLQPPAFHTDVVRVTVILSPAQQLRWACD